MAPDGRFIVPLPSMLQYCGVRKRTRFNGTIMAAVGERIHDGSDLPKKSNCLTTKATDNGPIAINFQNEEYFNAAECDLGGEATDLTKFCLLLAILAVGPVEKDIAPWMMYEVILAMEVDKGDRVKAFARAHQKLVPCRMPSPSGQRYHQHDDVWSRSHRRSAREG